MEKPTYYKVLWHNCNRCRTHYTSDAPHLRAYLCDDCWNAIVRAGIKRVWYSDYGNRMINPYCYGSAQESCWGAITTTQPVNLAPSDINERLAKLFSNPGGRYYQIDKEKEHKNRKVRGKVYGQPILYVKSKLCVFLGTNRKTLTDWNYFYNLEDGGGIYLKNRKLDDHVRGYKRDSHALFIWFRTSNSSPVGYKNNPTLVFPGLKGMKINDRNSDLDVRPSGGVDRPSSKFEEAV